MKKFRGYEYLDTGTVSPFNLRGWRNIFNNTQKNCAACCFLSDFISITLKLTSSVFGNFNERAKQCRCCYRLPDECEITRSLMHDQTRGTCV